MPFIRTISPDEADGKLRELYEEIRKKRGRVANFYPLLSLDPDSLRAHRDSYFAAMYSDGGLARLEREAMAVAVSVANECAYCLHHHAEALRAAGGSEALVDCLTEGDLPDDQPKRLQRLVYFSRKLTLLPNSMKRQDVDDLRDCGLTDFEILQAVEITAFYNSANRLANALGAEIEGDEG
ncbi:MAG: peroxidase-related enzyme [bacterium]|nr:peroxidase-related enzyme [bacterium]